MSWQSGFSTDDPSAYPTGSGLAPPPPPVQAPSPYSPPNSYSLPQPAYGQTGMAPRSKTTAILLAVFLAPFTWLYTYKTDAKKFWIGLGVYVVGLITSIFFVGIFICLGIWIWAIVDAAQRDDSFYASYPA